MNKKDLAREGDLFYMGFLDGERGLKKAKEDNDIRYRSREYIQGYQCGVSEQARYLLGQAQQQGLDPSEFEWLTNWKKGKFEI